MCQLLNAEVNRQVTVKPGGGGGEGFQVMGMIEWGQKSKCKKKIRRASKKTPKNP